MTINDETKLQIIFKRALQKTHRDGLLQGSKAICDVVLKKAKDKTKNTEERLKDIIDFCNTSLGNKQGKGIL